MTDSPSPHSPFAIVHTSNLLADDLHVFEHGLALALASRGHLYTLHAQSPDQLAPDQALPDPEPLLAQWGKSQVSHVNVCHGCCDDTLDTLLNGLELLAPHLVIVGKRAEGNALETFFRESISEGLMRNVRLPLLVVPEFASGLIDPRTGDVTLRRVVIPVEDEAILLRALDETRKLLDRLHIHHAQITLLRVESGAPAAEMVWPEGDRDERVELLLRGGDLEETILAEADQADLLVMATRGHDSLLDVLRGSHTERVLRRSPIPVLVLPL